VSEMQTTTIGSLMKGMNEGRVPRETVKGVVGDLMGKSGSVISWSTEVQVPRGTIAPKEKEREAG
jgi:hypothetical protein